MLGFLHETRVLWIQQQVGIPGFFEGIDVEFCGFLRPQAEGERAVAVGAVQDREHPDEEPVGQ